MAINKLEKSLIFKNLLKKKIKYLLRKRDETKEKIKYYTENITL